VQQPVTVKTDAQRIEEVERLAKAGAAAVPELIARLAEPSWVVRRAVVAALAQAGDAAVEPLVTQLATRRDDETRIAAVMDALAASTGDVTGALEALTLVDEVAVVADAAQVLGRRPEPPIAVLARLTGHPNDNVAVAAIEALGRTGSRAAVAPLVAAVRTGSFFRRFPAIDVLGRTGDPRAVAPLAALVSEPPYELEAIRALGRTGDPRAAAPLVAVVTGRSASYARLAALALMDLRGRHEREFGGTVPVDAAIRTAAAGHFAGRRLNEILSGADASEAVAICQLVGLVGDASAAPTLTRLLDGAPEVASAAADALPRLGVDPAASLVTAIREGHSAQRRALLPLVTNACGAAAILACVHDPCPDVRVLACEVAARLGVPGTVRGLFPLLADPSPAVCIAALSAVQAIGGADAERLALEAARSEVAALRRAALRVLAYFGSTAAVDLFVKALEDPDPRVVEAAIQGLPLLDDPRASAALLASARSASTTVRGAAMRAMAQSGNVLQVAPPLLVGLGDPDPWVRYYACQSLGRLGCEAATRPITERLADEAGQVRVAAVEALSHLKSDAALEALTKATGSADADVRRAAIVGLGIAGRAEVLPILLHAARSADASTRLVALSSLAGFKQREALAALAEAASDPEETVRLSAIGYLAGREGVEATEALIALLATSEALDRVQAALSMHVRGRVEGIVRALSRADDELAPRLTSALARMRRRTAVGAVVAALESPNVCARKAAAATLAAIGTTQAIEALTRARTDDPDPEVRTICSLLLVQ
jgi:HEAT repeat protein